MALQRLFTIIRHWSSLASQVNYVLYQDADVNWGNFLDHPIIREIGENLNYPFQIWLKAFAELQANIGINEYRRQWVTSWAKD